MFKSEETGKSESQIEKNRDAEFTGRKCECTNERLKWWKMREEVNGIATVLNGIHSLTLLQKKEDFFNSIAAHYELMK